MRTFAPFKCTVVVSSAEGQVNLVMEIPVRGIPYVYRDLLSLQSKTFFHTEYKKLHADREVASSITERRVQWLQELIEDIEGDMKCAAGTRSVDPNTCNAARNSLRTLVNCMKTSSEDDDSIAIITNFVRIGEDNE